MKIEWIQDFNNVWHMMRIFVYSHEIEVIHKEDE